MSKQSAQALLPSEWPKWPLADRSPPQFKKTLSGGSGFNETWLLANAQRKFVFKQQRRLATTFQRHWQDECLLSLFAARLGISPRVIYQNPAPNEYLLLEYLHDTGPENQLPPGSETALANTLATLHGSPLIEALSVRDYRLESRRYHKQILEITPKVEAWQKHLFDRAIQCADRLMSDARRVNSHHDISRGNLIVDQQRVLLIDWEYACKTHPYFDLVCAAKLYPTPESRELFLTAYQARTEPLDSELFDAATLLFHFYDFAWTSYLVYAEARTQLQPKLAVAIQHMRESVDKRVLC